MHKHYASRETCTTNSQVSSDDNDGLCVLWCAVRARRRRRRSSNGRRARDRSRKNEPVLGCGARRPRRLDAETRPAAYRRGRTACSRPGLPTFPSLVHSHKRSPPPPQPPPPTQEFPLYHPFPPRPSPKGRRQ